MSVFKKLKGSFQTAQQDIVDGLRALTSTDSQSRNISSKQINLDAGADILYRFQSNWSLIHHGTSEAAQRAEEVAVLFSLLKIWDKYAECVTNLEQEARKVSGIFATLAQLHTLLDGLQQDFLVAEKELDILEDICEEQDFRNRCLKEQKNLAIYRAKKKSEVEKLKVDFAHLHAKKMAEVESVKKMNLQERAEAFMSAFQDDVKYYHTHGHHDRLPIKTSSVSSLSRVELDQDSQALDSFLGANGESDGQGNLESSGEGAYFEDDYIADYSVKEDDYIADYSVKEDNYIADYSVKEDDYIADYSVKEDDYIADYSVKEDNYIGDYSVKDDYITDYSVKEDDYVTVYSVKDDDYIADNSIKEDVDFFDKSGYNSSSVIREMELEEESYNEKNPSYDDECPQVLDEPDIINISSSSELMDDLRGNDDTTENSQRVDGDMSQIDG